MSVETTKTDPSGPQLSEKAQRLLAAHDRVVRNSGQRDPAFAAQVSTAA